MLSFYHAYQAYEQRWMRGELSVNTPRRPRAPAGLPAAILLRLAGLLLRVGNALQQRYGQALSSTYQEQP